MHSLDGLGSQIWYTYDFTIRRTVGFMTWVVLVFFSSTTWIALWVSFTETSRVGLCTSEACWMLFLLVHSRGKHRFLRAC